MVRNASYAKFNGIYNAVCEFSAEFSDFRKFSENWHHWLHHVGRESYTSGIKSLSSLVMLPYFIPLTDSSKAQKMSHPLYIDSSKNPTPVIQTQKPLTYLDCIRINDFLNFRIITTPSNQLFHLANCVARISDDTLFCWKTYNLPTKKTQIILFKKLGVCHLKKTCAGQRESETRLHGKGGNHTN